MSTFQFVCKMLVHSARKEQILINVRHQHHYQRQQLLQMYVSHIQVVVIVVHRLGSRTVLSSTVQLQKTILIQVTMDTVFP